MARSARPGWLALAGSLLLHGLLIGAPGWQLPQHDPLPDPPLQAQLVAVPAPIALPRPLPAAERSPARLTGVAMPPAEPPAMPPVEPVAETGEAGAPAAPAVVAAAAASAAEGETPPVQQTAPPPLNPLPSRLDLRYQVRVGPATGEQTLVWISEGERYTITSVAAATGLASVFYSGRFVQVSRGHITPHGLLPEEFRDQRGDRLSRTQFDAAQGLLTLTPATGEPRHFNYQGDIQDALSLFFQLALTAPPQGRVSYSVFNGKKLRDYTYQVRGEATLDTALGALRTLHLAREGGDGRFELWLAIDRHYLPVRVVRGDEKGNEMELDLVALAP